MSTKIIVIISLVLVTTTLLSLSILHNHAGLIEEQQEMGEKIKLPESCNTSNTSVEAALSQRRSIRTYSGDKLTIEEVSQLLWAAQGITAPWGGRTAPSAGALYPLELYLVVGDVEGIDKGVYRYRPGEHELEKVKADDIRDELADAALGQEYVSEQGNPPYIMPVGRKG
jgi:hypothetical protein